MSWWLPGWTNSGKAREDSPARISATEALAATQVLGGNSGNGQFDIDGDSDNSGSLSLYQDVDEENSTQEWSNGTSDGGYELKQRKIASSLDETGHFRHLTGQGFASRHGDSSHVDTDTPTLNEDTPNVHCGNEAETPCTALPEADPPGPSSQQVDPEIILGAHGGGNGDQPGASLHMLDCYKPDGVTETPQHNVVISMTDTHPTWTSSASLEDETKNNDDNNNAEEEQIAVQNYGSAVVKQAVERHPYQIEVSLSMEGMSSLEEGADCLLPKDSIGRNYLEGVNESNTTSKSIPEHKDKYLDRTAPDAVDDVKHCPKHYEQNSVQMSRKICSTAVVSLQSSLNNMFHEDSSDPQRRDEPEPVDQADGVSRYMSNQVDQCTQLLVSVEQVPKSKEILALQQDARVKNLADLQDHLVNNAYVIDEQDCSNEMRPAEADNEEARLLQDEEHKFYDSSKSSNSSTSRDGEENRDTECRSMAMCIASKVPGYWEDDAIHRQENDAVSNLQQNHENFCTVVRDADDMTMDTESVTSKSLLVVQQGAQETYGNDKHVIAEQDCFNQEQPAEVGTLMRNMDSRLFPKGALKLQCETESVNNLTNKDGGGNIHSHSRTTSVCTVGKMPGYLEDGARPRQEKNVVLVNLRNHGDICKDPNAAEDMAIERCIDDDIRGVDTIEVAGNHLWQGWHLAERDISDLNKEASKSRAEDVQQFDQHASFEVIEKASLEQITKSLPNEGQEIDPANQTEQQQSRSEYEPHPPDLHLGSNKQKLAGVVNVGTSADHEPENNKLEKPDQIEDHGECIEEEWQGMEQFLGSRKEPVRSSTRQLQSEKQSEAFDVDSSSTAKCITQPKDAASKELQAIAMEVLKSEVSCFLHNDEVSTHAETEVCVTDVASGICDVSEIIEDTISADSMLEKNAQFISLSPNKKGKNVCSTSDCNREIGYEQQTLKERCACDNGTATLNSLPDDSATHKAVCQEKLPRKVARLTEMDVWSQLETVGSNAKLLATSDCDSAKNKAQLEEHIDNGAHSFLDSNKKVKSSDSCEQQVTEGQYRSIKVAALTPASDPGYSKMINMARAGACQELGMKADVMTVTTDVNGGAREGSVEVSIRPLIYLKGHQEWSSLNKMDEIVPEECSKPVVCRHSGSHDEETTKIIDFSAEVTTKPSSFSGPDSIVITRKLLNSMTTVRAASQELQLQIVSSTGVRGAIRVTVPKTKLLSTSTNVGDMISMPHLRRVSGVEEFPFLPIVEQFSSSKEIGPVAVRCLDRGGIVHVSTNRVDNCSSPCDMQTADKLYYIADSTALLSSVSDARYPKVTNLYIGGSENNKDDFQVQGIEHIVPYDQTADGSVELTDEIISPKLENGEADYYLHSEAKLPCPWTFADAEGEGLKSPVIGMVATGVESIDKSHNLDASICLSSSNAGESVDTWEDYDSVEAAAKISSTSDPGTCDNKVSDVPGSGIGANISFSTSLEHSEAGDSPYSEKLRDSEVHSLLGTQEGGSDQTHLVNSQKDHQPGSYNACHLEDVHCESALLSDDLSKFETMVGTKKNPSSILSATKRWPQGPTELTQRPSPIEESQLEILPEKNDPIDNTCNIAHAEAEIVLEEAMRLSPHTLNELPITSMPNSDFTVELPEKECETSHSLSDDIIPLKTAPLPNEGHMSTDYPQGKNDLIVEAYQMSPGYPSPTSLQRFLDQEIELEEEIESAVERNISAKQQGIFEHSNAAEIVKQAGGGSLTEELRGEMQLHRSVSMEETGGVMTKQNRNGCPIISDSLAVFSTNLPRKNMSTPDVDCTKKIYLSKETNLEAGVDDKVSALSSCNTKEEFISMPILVHPHGPCEGVEHTDPVLFHPLEDGSVKEGLEQLEMENSPTGENKKWRIGQNVEGGTQMLTVSSVKLEIQDINEPDKVGQLNAAEYLLQEEIGRKTKRRHLLSDRNNIILSKTENNIGSYSSKGEIRSDYLKVNKKQKKTRKNEKCLHSTTETNTKANASIERQNAKYGKMVNSEVLDLDHEGCGAPQSAASTICTVCGRESDNRLLVSCETCSVVCHMDCANLGLVEAFDFGWSCDNCRIPDPEELQERKDDTPNTKRDVSSETKTTLFEPPTEFTTSADREHEVRSQAISEKTTRNRGNKLTVRVKGTFDTKEPRTISLPCLEPKTKSSKHTDAALQSRFQAHGPSGENLQSETLPRSTKCEKLTGTSLERHQPRSLTQNDRQIADARKRPPVGQQKELASTFKTSYEAHSAARQAPRLRLGNEFGIEIEKENIDSGSWLHVNEPSEYCSICRNTLGDLFGDILCCAAPGCLNARHSQCTDMSPSQRRFRGEWICTACKPKQMQKREDCEGKDCLKPPSVKLEDCERKNHLQPRKVTRKRIIDDLINDSVNKKKKSRSVAGSTSEACKAEPWSDFDFLDFCEGEPQKIQKIHGAQRAGISEMPDKWTSFSCNPQSDKQYSSKKPVHNITRTFDNKRTGGDPGGNYVSMDSEEVSLRLYTEKENAPEWDQEKDFVISSGRSGNEQAVSTVKTEPGIDKLSPRINIESSERSAKKGGRRQTKPWTLREETALQDGVSKFGFCWREILNNARDRFHSQRTTVDLKDKWRNMSKKRSARK